ncbi:hypothetical protein Tco_0891752 [Tanacetum coccineum]|uniref:Uncharacterized protein n=1 Tax=Tanacetum coccineum TaxID=301880 RepID=A0ABQ5C445_9ASTR
MSSITGQQTKLDLELVPKENRLDIGKCNGRIPHGFSPREPNFQVTSGLFRPHLCYQHFSSLLISLQSDPLDLAPSVTGVVTLIHFPLMKTLCSFLRDLDLTTGNAYLRIGPTGSWTSFVLSRGTNHLEDKKKHIIFYGFGLDCLTKSNNEGNAKRLKVRDEGKGDVAHGKGNRVYYLMSALTEDIPSYCMKKSKFPTLDVLFSHEDPKNSGNTSSFNTSVYYLESFTTQGWEKTRVRIHELLPVVLHWQESKEQVKDQFPLILHQELYKLRSHLRGRKDKDKDEDPSAGSDRGLKRRKTCKEAK